MTIPNFLLLSFCVITISIGQILYKMAGQELAISETLFSYRAILFGGSGIVLYGIATIAWIYLLKYLSVTQIYPILALCYVIVPFLNWLFFAEKFSATYLTGLIIIIAGVTITSMASGEK